MGEPTTKELHNFPKEFLDPSIPLNPSKVQALVDSEEWKIVVENYGAKRTYDAIIGHLEEERSRRPNIGTGTSRQNGNSKKTKKNNVDIDKDGGRSSSSPKSSKIVRKNFEDNSTIKQEKTSLPRKEYNSTPMTTRLQARKAAKDLDANKSGNSSAKNFSVEGNDASKSGKTSPKIFKVEGDDFDPACLFVELKGILPANWNATFK